MAVSIKVRYSISALEISGMIVIVNDVAMPKRQMIRSASV